MNKQELGNGYPRALRILPPSSSSTFSTVLEPSRAEAQCPPDHARRLVLSENERERVKQGRRVHSSRVASDDRPADFAGVER
jgi:hypothetical protein